MEQSRCNYAGLRRAMRRIGQLYDDLLSPVGLRSTQYTLLVHIERMRRPAVTELATEMVMDRSALAHTLQTLQRSGWVTVTPDPLDRRTRRVELTAQGLDKINEAKILWRNGQDRFESVVGTNDAADLRAMMDRLASNAFADAFQKPSETTGPQVRS